MKTRILTLLGLAVFIISSCTSEDIPIAYENELSSKETTVLNVDEAKALLQEFVADAFTKSSESFAIKDHKMKILYIDNTEVLPVTLRDTIPVYEFSTEMDGQEGYSVVVGDKRVEKVLISVPYGSLSDTSFIEPLRLYFRDIPLLVKQDLEQYYNGTRETILQTRMTVEAAYKSMSTLWGQSYPYNAKCPNQSAAGCVAIAVSQVLAYHKVPSSLDWTSILSSPFVTSSSSSTVIDQVSTLIHDVGVKVNTTYGAFESSAPKTYVASTLSSYGLKCSGFIPFSVESGKYNIQNGGPFILGAQSSSGGHMWVCDAWKRHIYEDGTYYDYLNMNWGWDGSSNGFYLVETPTSFSAGGYLFNSGFTMTSRIYK